jgi:hypothetical protein
MALIALGATLVVDLISFALVGDQVIVLSGWTDIWAYVLYLYVVFPLTVGAYVWVSQAAAEMFHGLRQSKVIVASHEEFDRFVAHSVHALYSHPGWSIAALIVVAIVAVYYAFIYTLGWPLQTILLRAFKVLLLYVPGWYVVCQIVARQIVTIWGLRRVFRHFEVSPHPLHPDRCGGLRAIKDYAVGFTYVIAIAGIAVGLMAYVTLRGGGVLSADTALWIGVYVVLALFCFFLPPWTAHAAMTKAKHRLLLNISRQFQQDYARTTASLSSETGEFKERVERVQRLRTLYQLTDDFAVWPFDTATLRRFIVTVAAPLAPLLIELAINVGRSLLRSQ